MTEPQSEEERLLWAIFSGPPCDWCGKFTYHDDGCRLGLEPNEATDVRCPCGLKERPGSCGWCEE